MGSLTAHRTREWRSQRRFGLLEGPCPRTFLRSLPNGRARAETPTVRCVGTGSGKEGEAPRDLFRVSWCVQRVTDMYLGGKCSAADSDSLGGAGQGVGRDDSEFTVRSRPALAESLFTSGRVRAPCEAIQTAFLFRFHPRRLYSSHQWVAVGWFGFFSPRHYPLVCLL